MDGHEVHRSDEESNESDRLEGEEDLSSDGDDDDSSAGRNSLSSSGSSVGSDSAEKTCSDNPTLIDAVITTSEEDSDSSSVDIESHTIAFRSNHEDSIDVEDPSSDREDRDAVSSSISAELIASIQSADSVPRPLVSMAASPGEDDKSSSPSRLCVSFRNLRSSPVPLSLRARSAMGNEETSFSSGPTNRCSSASWTTRRARSRSSTSVSVQFRPRRLATKSHLSKLTTKEESEAPAPKTPSRDMNDFKALRAQGDTLRLGVGLWHPAVRLGTIVRKLGQVGGEAIKVGGLLWDTSLPTLQSSQSSHVRRLSVDSLRHSRTNHLTQSVMTIPDDQLLHNVLDGYHCSSGDDDCQEPTPRKLVNTTHLTQ